MNVGIQNGSYCPRVLCVDADHSMFGWIRKNIHLVSADAKIAWAKTGREAFTQIIQKDFDLCIFDYALPDMTGPNLCSLVRQMGHEMPILFFSALDRFIDREKAKAAGSSDYLSKCEDMDMFAEVVGHLLKNCKPLHLGMLTSLPSNIKAMSLSQPAPLNIV